MKIAALIGQEVKSGKWVMIAGPETAITEQKIMFKTIAVGNGKSKHGEYREIAMPISPFKRRKFHSPTGSPVSIVSDDLTNLNEPALKAVIAGESLKVQFNADHEKTRAAIRKERTAGVTTPEAKPEPEPKKDK